MKLNRGILVLVFMVLSLLIAACSSGGPSDNEVENLVRSEFWCAPDVLMINQASSCTILDIETSECELTNNQKAERGIRERWVLNFTVVRGDSSEKGRMTVDLTNSNDWSVWSSMLATCD